LEKAGAAMLTINQLVQLGAKVKSKKVKERNMILWAFQEF
jgi:hypothetical protein